MAERKSPFDYGDDERPAKPGMAPKPPRGGSPFDYGTDPVDKELYSPKEETASSKALDFLSAASGSFSMGMTPRIMGATRYLSGGAPSYSEAVNQELRDAAIRRERSPYTSLAGDVTGGAVQTAVPGMGVLGRTTSVSLGGALPGVRGIAARMAGYGAEGGVLGAAQAAGHTYSGNPEDYARNALTGGAFSAALGAPFGRYADVRPRSTAEIPNSRQLRDSASDRYTATHSLPIEYPAPHFWRGIDALEQQLQTGPRATNPVRSAAVWDTLRLARQGRNQMPPGSTNPTVTPRNIDDLRQQLTGIREPGAYQARQWLDNYMATAPMSRGTAADRTEAARILTAARGDYRAGKRTQTIEESNQWARDKTANKPNVAGAYEGGLTGLLSPTSREGRWYTPTEKAEIRAAARRDELANAANKVAGMGGNIVGGGSVLGGAGLAYQTGDWLPAVAGVGIPAAAALARGHINRSAVRKAEGLADTMATRSPLYRENAANAPVIAGPGLNNLAETSRNAITFQMLDQLGRRGYLEGQETP